MENKLKITIATYIHQSKGEEPNGSYKFAFHQFGVLDRLELAESGTCFFELLIKTFFYEFLTRNLEGIDKERFFLA